MAEPLAWRMERDGNMARQVVLTGTPVNDRPAGRYQPGLLAGRCPAGRPALDHGVDTVALEGATLRRASWKGFTGGRPLTRAGGLAMIKPRGRGATPRISPPPANNPLRPGEQMIQRWMATARLEAERHCRRSRATPTGTVSRRVGLHRGRRRADRVKLKSRRGTGRQSRAQFQQPAEQPRQEESPCRSR